jgi:predicted Ser/Thr protein kinase
MSKHDDDTCPHLVRASLLEAENTRLKAEVERLRKAGDDLVLSIEWRNVVVSIPPTMSLIESLSFLEVSEKCKCNLHNFYDDIKAWNAAKEGKPSV